MSRIEPENHRYEIWALSRTPEGKRRVRRIVTAPTIGVARAASEEVASRLPDWEIVIQDRAHKHWFKP